MSVRGTIRGTRTDDVLIYLAPPARRFPISHRRSDLGGIRREDMDFVWDSSEHDALSSVRCQRRVARGVRDGAGVALLTIGAFGRTAVAGWLVGAACSG